MSGSYTQTPNLGLYKPTLNSDTGTWGVHLNANADMLDTAFGPTSYYLPTTGGQMTGPLLYTATGGTTARAAQDRAADIYNVRDFGAIGDGNSHPLSTVYATLVAAQAVYPFVTALTQELDYAATQLAINLAQNNVQQLYARKTVYIPAGHYLWDTGVVITNALKFKGDGRRASVISLKTSATVPAIVVMPQFITQDIYVRGFPPNSVELADFYLESLNTSALTGVHGIQFTANPTNPTYSTLRMSDITIYGFPDHGFLSNTGAISGFIEAMNLYIGASTSWCAELNSALDGRWTGCEFTGGGRALDGSGNLLLTGASGQKFFGCNIYSSRGPCLQFYKTGGGAAFGGSQLNEFIGCSIDGAATHGVIYDNRQAGAPDLFVGGHIANNTGADVYVTTNAAAGELKLIGTMFTAPNTSQSNSQWNIQFQGTGNYVTAVDAWFAVVPATAFSNINQVRGSFTVEGYNQRWYMTGPGSFQLLNTNQYGGFVLSNSASSGTRAVAAIAAYENASGVMDTGVLSLYRAGAVQAQLSASSGFAPCFVNNDFYLGNGASNAAPAGRGLRATDGSGTDISGAPLALLGGRGTGAGNGGAITLQTAPAGTTGTTLGTPSTRLTVDAKGNVVMGGAALATTATDGFFYIDGGAGAPTGVPTSYGGRIPMYYDTTNHKLWLYDAGWKGVVVA